MAQFKYSQAIPVILCLGFALASQAAAGPPALSPLKQTSEGQAKAAGPLYMPLPADPTAPTGPLGSMVTRDMRTGEVTVRDGVTAQEFLDSVVTHGGAGLATGTDPGGGAKNFTGWTQVTFPHLGDKPQHVKLFQNWPTKSSECSGTLIDPYHVITAGHCVFTYDTAPPSWADVVTVWPGFENNDAPWGFATAVQMHSWEGWTQDEEAGHDIAVIDLDRPLGVFTGWRGFGYNTDCDFFDYGNWHHYTYPAETPYDGLLMFENYGDFDDCYTYTASWDMPSWGGSSGGGSIRDNATVFAVLRGSDRMTITEAARITSTKFSHIQGWLAADVPAGADIRPIFVQAEGVDFTAGDQLDSFSFVIASYGGLGFATDVICDMYLSSDANITTGDVWLDDLTVSVNLPAMGGQTVGVYPPPTVPLTTSEGQYFLGVILNYADANPANNVTASTEVDYINVGCATPGYPVITSPSEGETCQPLSRTIDWTDLPDIDTYQLRVGTWCGGGALYTIETGSQYTVTGLANGLTYYAQVRAKRYCGAWGGWSSCRSFTTEDIPTSNVAFLTPGDDDICQDAALVTIAWQPVPGATRYELRVGENCYSGNTYSLQPETPYKDLTGLLADTTYRYLVRVRGACLNWGDWSECRTFSTLPPNTFVSHSPFPPDGYPCVGPNVNLSWWPADYPATYEVEWGRSCSMDTSATTIINVMDLPTMAGGLWYWRVRAIHVCGVVGDWSPCWAFGVDDLPPYWEDYLVSVTHTVSTWSTEPQVMTRWAEADDDCGLEYRVLWDHEPATVPDELITAINETEYTSDPLADGDDHWFHVLAKDQPGNLAANPQHLGPFLIDATAPSEVQLDWVSLPTGWPGDFDELTVGWVPATDATSGVAGYSYLLHDFADPLPDDVVDTTLETVTLTLDPGDWWFKVRAVDAAGNEGPVVQTGQFVVDPSLPAFINPVAGQLAVEDEVLQVQWEPVSGAFYGALYVSYDGGQTHVQITSLSAEQLTVGLFPWTVPAEITDEAVLLLRVIEGSDDYWAASPVFLIRTTTGIDDGPPEAVTTARVANYPNPFNPATTIRFAVPAPAFVRLTIFDMQGRLVCTLHDGPIEGPGWHEALWDGKDAAGQQVAAGIYFCRLVAGEFSATSRMVLVK
ncbi:trypsin-like serine protease [bacterium]|nr:trypsin-like serine protease [bacterium]